MTKPLTVVIFGASGDLTSLKLIPALYRLFCRGRLPAEARIVGMARSDLGDDGFRSKLASAVQEHAKTDWNIGKWNEFAQRVFYVAGDAAQSDGLAHLQSWLKTNEGESGGRRLYYLSVSPTLYADIVTRLGEAGMARDQGDNWRRVVIEKPFGRDLASARELNRIVQTHFHEDQVFRIDHYLGKETVQNIMVFRFGNTLFEPVWNANYVDHVQITVAESVTVGSRGAYYDQSGVLRDMFQNHLLQLLALVAMEAPARYAAGPLRREKQKVFDAVALPTLDEACGHVVAGQYEGYLKEKGIPPGSKTPTFAAVRLHIDNWRWKGVPFFLRSGKGMAGRYSEVLIQFRCPPHLMFPLPPGATLQCNRLAMCIQPDEGIHLNFQTKVPGTHMEMRPADMDFHYRDSYPGVTIPEAYERLLQDAVNGDAALFMHSEEIERAWEIMDPLIAATERADATTPEPYAIGSTGPKCAETMLAREGRSWVTLCQH